jgi:hypothetical protein
MNTKPDFTQMSSSDLRAYVLEHRTDQEALQAYVDKRQVENPVRRKYSPNDNISGAIDDYLKSLDEKRRQNET